MDAKQALPFINVEEKKNTSKLSNTYSKSKKKNHFKILVFCYRCLAECYRHDVSFAAMQERSLKYVPRERFQITFILHVLLVKIWQYKMTAG